MSFNKKFFTTGGIVASSAAPAAFDPLQNFETVTYTGNGSTQKITGHIRKGAAFNGSSSQIEVSTTSTTPVDFSSKNYSLSLWVNTTSTTTGILLSKYGDTDATRAFTLQAQADGTIQQYERGTGTSETTQTTTTINDGNWHHIVVVRSSTSTIIYIDNSPTTNNNTFTSNNGGTEPFRIGRDNPASPNWFNGKIDQVRIFNKALDSGEVGQLALETYADPKKSTTDYFGDGSGVALYELDEDANTTPYYPYGTGAIDSGQSAVFNGSSSEIDLPNSFFNNNASHSLSFWVFFNDASPASEQQIFFAGEENFRLQTDGTLRFRRWTGSGNDIDSSAVSENQWYHITCTYNTASGMVLYINGTSVGTNSSTTNVLTNATRSLGYRGDNNSAYFNGKIDQVRIYSSALSASDVEALASETNVPTANLVAHYKLDGDATDETGNNHASDSNVTYTDPAEFPNVAYNGTPTNVNFLGMAFQPDLIWVKKRSSATSSDHLLNDSVRGVNKILYPNLTNAEDTAGGVGSAYLNSFDSNGFTVGSSTYYNGSGETYVAWCWKAADTTTTISAGTVGNTIASDVRANQDAGFSIVKYTGNSTAGATIGHGLSSVPQMIIVKRLSLPVDNWAVYNETIGNTKRLALDESGAASPSGRLEWNSTTPTSTVFTVGNHSAVNQNSSYIAYCFHSVDEYQKVGSYTGNTSTLPSVNLGFEPRWVMIKEATDTGSWLIYDSVRPSDPATQNDKILFANSSSQESTSAGNVLNFTSTGFDIEVGSSELNTNGNTYIYLAIA